MRLHQFQLALANHVPRLAREWHMDGDSVRLAQQLLQVNLPRTGRGEVLSRDVRITGQHLSEDGHGPLDELSTNAPQADHADRLSGRPQHGRAAGPAAPDALT